MARLECDEGQLCPYDDCCWSCGFSNAGWYICPRCKREFWAQDTNSDYEDFHTFYAGNRWKHTPPNKPSIIPTAADCGRSWGTPRE